jgi:oligoendopeptidase F
MTVSVLSRRERKFIGEEFLLTDWDSVKNLYQNLADREINSLKNLEDFIYDRSELESYLSENMAWRYIKMTCDTQSEGNQANFNYFIENIQPQMAAFSDVLNKKVANSEFQNQLSEDGIEIMLRSLKKSIEIFREENIAIETQIQNKQTEYQAISAGMSVVIDEEEMTLQKAADKLLSIDRETRENTYLKIAERRYQDAEKLDVIFNELIEMRHQVAQNAGFANFRDYMFAAMGRFDYTAQDCFDFHEAVQQNVMPFVEKMAIERMQKLAVDEIKPWDLKVDPDGNEALKPFVSGADLLEKTIQCFDKIDLELGNYLRIMRTMGHFDLESRKGKAPGGYNYPLEEIGVPFIFMNATSNLRDLVTMVHEGGHAVHSFVTRDLSINAFRGVPSEVAELASMAMELISMEHWDVYFDSENELKRAKIEHLEDILETLPWIACIDKFQHWIYENPSHSVFERNEKWVEIFSAFSDSTTNWEGQKKFRNKLWQRQLHLYEVPFYYIEYGMAQLGAIAVWRNYKNDPKRGLEGYLKALKLGYTKTIGEIYQNADIKFDFSSSNIKELMQFVADELDGLKG